MTDLDEIAKGLSEEKHDREIAFDYRELSAKDFFEKYGQRVYAREWSDQLPDCYLINISDIENIDAGLDSLLFTPR